MGRKAKIPNVDPKQYTNIDLLNDVAEKVMHEFPGSVNILLHMRCEIPTTNGYIDVNDDQSVMKIFKVYQSQLVINVHVFDIDIIPSHQDAVIVDKNIVNDKENL